MRMIDADKIKFKWINGVICVEQKDIEKMPTLDAVKHAKWEINIFDGGQSCSKCGSIGKKEYKYCPNCGSKMDGERKEE